MPGDEAIRDAMVELAKNSPARNDLEVTLGGVTDAAVSLIDEIDFADIMLINDDQFRSVKPTRSFLVELDAKQMQLGEGPCLAAMTDGSVVRSPDLSRDPRWPTFAAVAIETGVLGILSFQLYKREGGAGALNLFSLNEVDQFTPETEAIGAMLATHAAVALMATDQHNQMESALVSNDVIGQAKGVLMERFKIDAVTAFDMLLALSQDTNTPMRKLAAQVVDPMI